MATLDVSEIIVCAEFADTFQVEQRPETLSQSGRSQVTPAGPTTQLGVIYPTGDNRLQRQADKEFGLKTLTCVTTYRLRTASPGAQPDRVYYRGNIYIVTEVEDYSQYGAGFVVAQLSSVQSIDSPPQ